MTSLLLALWRADSFGQADDVCFTLLADAMEFPSSAAARRRSAHRVLSTHVRLGRPALTDRAGGGRRGVAAGATSGLARISPRRPALFRRQGVRTPGRARLARVPDHRPRPPWGRQRAGQSRCRRSARECRGDFQPPGREDTSLLDWRGQGVAEGRDDLVGRRERCRRGIARPEDLIGSLGEVRDEAGRFRH